LQAAKEARIAARHRGFVEPLTYGSGVELNESAARSSGSQVVGIVRKGKAASVHRSQPLAPNRSPFGPPVVQRAVGRGSSLRVAPGGVERLLSVSEVAELLGVCTAIVYSLVARGELPHVRVSNAIRISERDLARYVGAKRKARAAGR
jgi:excisionase family DNA binding protein